MYKIPITLATPKLINLSVAQGRPKVKDEQLILLYLKFYSKSIEYSGFSSQFNVKYDSYKQIMKILETEKIVKPVNKKGKFQTYKLVKPNVQIFPHASTSDEYQVFKHLHSSNPPPPEISIILNPHALQMLKQIKKKFNSKPFKKNIIVSKSKTKSKAFQLLIGCGEIKKFAPKTYVLAPYHYQAIQQAILKKNPPIINCVDLQTIIRDTKWSNVCNVHNLQISAHFKGLYNDLLYSIDYNTSDSNTEDIEIVKDCLIENAYLTLTVHKHDTLIINIKCSEIPILTYDLLRLNKILAQVIGYINDHTSTFKYPYNYETFTVTKYDLALDGKLPYRVKKRTQFPYTNTDLQDLYLYVKKNYKSSDSSWIRADRRAINKPLTLHEFRAMLINSKVNVNHVQTNTENHRTRHL